MALASSWYDRSAPRSGSLRATATVALVALPFAAVSFVAAANGYLSFDHAALRAMAAHLRAGNDTTLFVYPPLPLWITLLVPRPAVAAAIAGAILMWLTSRRLEEKGFGRAARLVTVSAVLAHPAVLYTFTQSVHDAFAVLFLALAWIHYCDFLAFRHTRSAFAAGLTLAAAFFAGPHALAFAIAMALLAALLLDDPDPRGRVSAAFVLAFPAIGCLIAMAYIQWSAGARVEWFLPTVTHGGAAFDGSRVMTIFGDLLRDARAVPLYLVAAVAAARVSTARLAVFAAPPLVLAILGAAGIRQSTAFVVALFAVMAALSAPAVARRRTGSVLAAIAVVQTLLAYGVALSDDEQGRWMAAAFAQRPAAADLEERAIAREVALLPPGSVWADPDKATRIIARLDSTVPFLTDSLAASDRGPLPAAARYVLLPNRPDFDPNPAGLRMHRFWPNWTLYARNVDLRQ